MMIGVYPFLVVRNGRSLVEIEAILGKRLPADLHAEDLKTLEYKMQPRGGRGFGRGFAAGH